MKKKVLVLLLLVNNFNKETTRVSVLYTFFILKQEKFYGQLEQSWLPQVQASLATGLEEQLTHLSFLKKTSRILGKLVKKSKKILTLYGTLKFFACGAKSPKYPLQYCVVTQHLMKNRRRRRRFFWGEGEGKSPDNQNQEKTLPVCFQDSYHTCLFSCYPVLPCPKLFSQNGTKIDEHIDGFSFSLKKGLK